MTHSPMSQNRVRDGAIHLLEMRRSAFLDAYRRAGATSDPDHWMEAALLAKQLECELDAALTAPPASEMTTEAQLRDAFATGAKWQRDQVATAPPASDASGAEGELADGRSAIEWRDLYRELADKYDAARANEIWQQDARTATIKEAAKIADDWVRTYGQRTIKHVSAREYAVDAVTDVADGIRELAAPAPAPSRPVDAGGVEARDALIERLNRVAKDSWTGSVEEWTVQAVLAMCAASRYLAALATQAPDKAGERDGAEDDARDAQYKAEQAEEAECDALFRAETAEAEITRLQAIIAALTPAQAPDKAGEREGLEAHSEQLDVWSSEIVGSLGMGGYLRDDLSYDDKVHIHAFVAKELREVAAALASAAHAPEKAVTRESLATPEGEERDFWLEAAEQHGVAWNGDGKAVCSEDALLKLMAVARQQGRDDTVLAPQPTGAEASRGDATYYPSDLKGADLLGWIVGYYGMQMPEGLSGKLLDLMNAWYDERAAIPTPPLSPDNVKWGDPVTVGGLIAQLQTLPADAPIYGTFNGPPEKGIDYRTGVRGVIISRERVEGRWIRSHKKELPYQHVIWTKPEPLPPDSTGPAGDETALYLRWRGQRDTSLPVPPTSQEGFKAGFRAAITPSEPIAAPVRDDGAREAL